MNDEECKYQRIQHFPPDVLNKERPFPFTRVYLVFLNRQRIEYNWKFSLFNFPKACDVVLQSKKFY